MTSDQSIDCLVEFGTYCDVLEVQDGTSFKALKETLQEILNIDHERNITVLYYDHRHKVYLNVDSDRQVKRMVTTFIKTTDENRKIKVEALQFEQRNETNNQQVRVNEPVRQIGVERESREVLNSESNQETEPSEESGRVFCLVTIDGREIEKIRMNCSSWEEVSEFFRSRKEISPEKVLIAQDRVHEPEQVQGEITEEWKEFVVVGFAILKRVFNVHDHNDHQKIVKRFLTDATNWNDIEGHMKKILKLSKSFTIIAFDATHDQQPVSGIITGDWREIIDILVSEREENTRHFFNGSGVSTEFQKELPFIGYVSNAARPPVSKPKTYQPDQFTETFESRQFTKTFEKGTFQKKDHQPAGFERVHARESKHTGKKWWLYDRETNEKYHESQAHVGSENQRTRVEAKHEQDRLHFEQQEKLREQDFLTSKKNFEQQEKLREQDFVEKKKSFEQQEIDKHEFSKEQQIQDIKNAGINGLKLGAWSTLLSSGFKGVVEVYRGKSVKDAAFDVAKDTVFGSATAGGTSLALSAVHYYGSNSTNRIFAAMSGGLVKNSNVIIPVLYLSWNVFKEYRKYTNKEITYKVLINRVISLAATTTGCVGGSLGAISLAGLFISLANPFVAIGIATMGGIIGGLVSQNIVEKVLDDIVKEDPQETLHNALDFFGLEKKNMHLVNERYKSLVKLHHPDYKGSSSGFVKLQTYYGILCSNVSHKKPDDQQAIERQPAPSQREVEDSRNAEYLRLKNAINHHV
jgi:hypothetical protein